MDNPVKYPAPQGNPETRHFWDQAVEGKLLIPEEVVHYSEWLHVMRDRIKQQQVIDVSKIRATIHPACHVYKMVLRGAQLTPREADTVIAYLVANLGPGAPAAPPAPLPGGPGRELVESRCTVCHSLERVTIVKRSKHQWQAIVANMYERWGVAAPEEAQAITAYLDAQFGRE